MTVLEWLSEPQAPARQNSAKLDSGILIFCGMGLLLSVTAILFGWLGLPGAVGL